MKEKYQLRMRHHIEQLEGVARRIIADCKRIDSKAGQENRIQKSERMTAFTVANRLEEVLVNMRELVVMLPLEGKEHEEILWQITQARVNQSFDNGCDADIFEGA